MNANNIEFAIAIKITLKPGISRISEILSGLIRARRHYRAILDFIDLKNVVCASRLRYIAQPVAIEIALDKIMIIVQCVCNDGSGRSEERRVGKGCIYCCWQAGGK